MVGCGKPKLKMYTLEEKKVYEERASKGDKEAEKFIDERIKETEKIYKETGDSKVQREHGEWLRMKMSITVGMPETEPAW